MSESAKLEASNVCDAGKPSWVLSISCTKKLYQSKGAKSAYWMAAVGVTIGGKVGGADQGRGAGSASVGLEVYKTG